MKGREMLEQIREVLGDKNLLDEIIVGMSEQEAQEMAEHIDQMNDLNLFDSEEESEKENES
jgi:ABC-type branched-subunit amino acid transport system ATPase component